MLVFKSTSKAHFLILPLHTSSFSVYQREREKGGEEREGGKEGERKGERRREGRRKEGKGAKKKKKEFKIAFAIEFPFLGLKDGRGLGDSSPPEGNRTLGKKNFLKLVML